MPPEVARFLVSASWRILLTKGSHRSPGEMGGRRHTNLVHPYNAVLNTLRRAGSLLLAARPAAQLVALPAYSRASSSRKVNEQNAPTNRSRRVANDTLHYSVSPARPRECKHLLVLVSGGESAKQKRQRQLEAQGAALSGPRSGLRDRLPGSKPRTTLRSGR